MANPTLWKQKQGVGWLPEPYLEAYIGRGLRNAWQPLYFLSELKAGERCWINGPEV